MNKVTCLLRTHRLKCGLTQQDLAALVPQTGLNRVSNVERGMRPPNAREILAYRVLFGVLPESIFPGAVGEVEEALARNAYRFHERLKHERSDASLRKRAFLEEVLARTAKRARVRS